MKTSNKILSTAFAAYLLFTAGNSAAILKEYKRAEASGKALITQLEKTSIHVLSVEGDNYIQASRGRKSSQTLGFWSPFDPETTPLRICGDTLYISGTSYGYVTLPDLKSFLRNGKPQLKAAIILSGSIFSTKSKSSIARLSSPTCARSKPRL